MHQAKDREMEFEVRKRSGSSVEPVLGKKQCHEEYWGDREVVYVNGSTSSQEAVSKANSEGSGF